MAASSRPGEGGKGLWGEPGECVGEGGQVRGERLAFFEGPELAGGVGGLGGGFGGFDQRGEGGGGGNVGGEGEEGGEAGFEAVDQVEHMVAGRRFGQGGAEAGDAGRGSGAAEDGAF